MVHKPLWVLWTWPPWVIAQQVVSAPESMQGMVERMGVAAVIVVAAYYMNKYFISKLDQKDAYIVDLTRQLIAASRESAQVIADNAAAKIEMSGAIRNLTTAVDRLQERRSAPRE